MQACGRDQQAISMILFCSHSLNLFVYQEQYGFAAKMRNQAVEQLKALETWVERQATGLDMAANPESLRQSFDKLLKVMSPLISPLQCDFLLFVEKHSLPL